MTHFSPKTILVPVALDPDDDFSFAEKSAQVAIDIAKCYGARVVLLNLVSAVSPGTAAPMDVSGKIYQVVSAVLQARLTRGREQLGKLEDEIKAQGVEVESKVLEALDKTSKAICEVAKDVSADLIVIGSHGRKGIKRVFLGSTAEKVVHLAPCPVFLIRPKDLQIESEEN